MKLKIRDAMMKKDKAPVFFIVLLLQCAGFAFVHAQNGSFAAEGEGGSSSGIEIKSSLDWERGILSAEVIVDLAPHGLKLPSGRVRAGEILEDEYFRLMLPRLLSIQADSSSTLYDLVERAELPIEALDRVSLGADKIPPSLSGDLLSIIGRYTIPIEKISSVLSGRGRSGDIPRPFIPSAAADYTGIIIIADTALPIHGRNSSALLEPCLSPKIWDNEMNLVFDRIMSGVSGQEEARPFVIYTRPENIFRPTPSGLDGRLAEIAGQNPLRIIAREVFGIVPTDPVIDREDALLILSTENNRRLLRENRVVIVVNSSTLVK